jgi:two-component system sensor histidine kinase UhpB
MRGSGRSSFFAWRGFNLQFILIAIMPLTILLVVMVFGSLMLHHDAMRSLVGERDLRTVRASANSLNEELFHRAETIRMMAKTQQYRQELQDFSGAVEEMQAPFDGGVALFSFEGQLLSAAPDSIFIGAPVSLLDAVKGLAVRTASQPVFSDAFSVQPGGPKFVLTVIRAGSSLLAGAFSPSHLSEISLQGAVDPSQATAWVLSQQGPQILYQIGAQNLPEPVFSYPGIADALEGQSGINYYQATDGEHVVAFSPIPLAGWVLVIEEPWEDTASPFLRPTQAAPLVLAPVLILAVIALWFGARRVIQPLQSLEKRAAELANGNFETIQQPVGGISEIRKLQTELVIMAEKVKAAQGSLHSYIGAITAGIETERRSLARELHDETIQSLIAINQRIQLILPNAQNDLEIKALAELQNLVQQAVQNLRRTIRGLRPIYLEDLGLATALRMLAQEVGAQEVRALEAYQDSSLSVDFIVEGVERRLGPEVELALYRMAQEALNNIVRHARASHVWLSLAFNATEVTLEIRDNGQGFKVPTRFEELAAQGHFGLMGLHERAELIGAKLEIVSTQWMGTRVLATITL